MKPLFGVESEYAILGLTDEGKSVDHTVLLAKLLSAARSRLPHLMGAREGDFFLQNGSRFYVDAGGHPELSSPECTNPWDLARYVLAGERLLSGLCSDLATEECGIREAFLYKCNVDYRGKTTWGCHESYLHCSDPLHLIHQIVPHLVSRIIYCGAGGFHPLSPGLEFSLSPRAAHLGRIVSANSTRCRGLVHLKNEPLCRGDYHRLHLICGESVCSQTSMWLKSGTTAVVIALVEAGLNPGDPVELANPLQALRGFAADPTCRVEADLVRRPPMNAIGLQRYYLEQAEAHAHRDFMPPWTEVVCRGWRRILDLLEDDPARLATKLDWPLKLEIFKSRTGKKGFDWSLTAPWTKIVKSLTDALERTDLKGKRLRVEQILGPQSPISGALSRLEPYLLSKGLEWAGLRPFLDLRKDLFEIDTRFGRLGPGGIFAHLDLEGVLDHHLPGVDRIDEAMLRPPSGSRAYHRGEAIGRLVGKAEASADWSGVWDFRGRRFMDLSDPFEESGNWQEMSGEHMPKEMGLFEGI